MTNLPTDKVKLSANMPALEELPSDFTATAKLAFRGTIATLFVVSTAIAFNAITTSEMDRLEEDLQVTQEDINTLAKEEQAAKETMETKKAAREAKEILHHNRKCVLASLKLEKKIEVSEPTKTECFLEEVGTATSNPSEPSK